MGPFDWSQLPYRPLELLGEGGMGSVHRALDPRLGREVAVKLLRDPSRDTTRARLLREGALSAALDHPHLLKLLAVHELGAQVALVFELVPGARPLDQAWGSALPERVRLLRDVALGLAHAHARGIVHRDLKPGNVLVDEQGRARVADFGVGFASGEERLTESGAPVGTPAFMAPEQLFRRGDPTPRTDVWALGVLLFQALTDRHPFPSGSLPELFDRIESGLSGPERALLREVPAPLAGLAERCLQPQPARRPADAGHVARALDEWLRDPQAAGSAASRARWPIVAGGAGLLALAAALTAVVPGPRPVAPSAGVDPARPATPDSASSPGAPPAALLAALRGPAGPARSWAALALLELPGLPASERALAQRIARALREEPLLRLRGPRRAGRQDWDVVWDPADPDRLVGLLERERLVVAWSLRSGELIGSRASSIGWKLARPWPGGALTLRDYEPGRGLWQVRLDGQDGWFAPPSARAAVFDFSPHGASQVVFLLRGDAQLERLGPEGSRLVEVPKSVEQAQVCAIGPEELLLALGDPSQDEVQLVTARLPPRGPCTWAARGGLSPGATVRLAADPETGCVAVVGEMGQVELVPREGPCQRLRAAGEPLTPLGAAWQDGWLWTLSRGPDPAGPTRLERWSRAGAGPPAVWPAGPRSKSARPAPGGHLLALAHEGDPDGIAAEVWYVGPLPP